MKVAAVARRAAIEKRILLEWDREVVPARGRVLTTS